MEPPKCDMSVACLFPLKPTQECVPSLNKMALIWVSVSAVQMVDVLVPRLKRATNSGNVVVVFSLFF